MRADPANSVSVVVGQPKPKMTVFDPLVDAPKVVEKEDQEELEAEVPPAEAVGAAAGGAAGKKKKKKKNKKGGNQNNDSASIPKSDSAAISEPEVTVKEVDVPSPVKEEKKFDEAVPIAAPAELAEEKKEEAAKPTAAEAAVVAELQQKISPMNLLPFNLPRQPQLQPLNHSSHRKKRFP